MILAPAPRGARAAGSEAPIAPISCHELWSLRLAGLEAGVSRESFSIDERGQARASASFVPGALARALGAPDLEAKALARAPAWLYWHQESRRKNGSSRSVEWRQDASGAFERVEDGRATVSGLSIAEPLRLDTLLLPRLALLGIATPGSARQARLFTVGGAPALALIERARGSRVFTARTDTMRATVEVDERERPISIELADGSSTLRAQLIEGGCGP